MAEKKITKIETINAIIEKYGMTGDDKAFLEHEVELIAKRNSYKSSKPTKKQVANASLAESICQMLTPNAKYTATDIAGMLGTDPDTNKPYSVQKTASLLTKLKADGKVVSAEIKRRAYYGLPGTDFTADEAKAEA